MENKEYPIGYVDYEEYERINKKRNLLIISGVVFSVITAWIYVFFKITLDPTQYHYRGGEFCFLLFAFLFNIIFWAAVLYAIDQLRDKSRASFYNVLGAFFIAIIPGIFILAGFLMSAIILYGHGILIILVGILSIFYTIKEHNSKHRFGAFCLIVGGSIYISILLLLNIPFMY